MPNFLDLPPELRDQIYTYLLHPTSNRRSLPSPSHQHNFATYDFRAALSSIYLLNRQIYLESRKTFHRLNTFVRVATPWEQAKHHVILEGAVNVIATDEVAARFEQHSMDVVIDAYYPNPDSPSPGIAQAMHYFVVLAETGDLDKFCRSWYYSSVSMPYLNAHLALSLKLRDPYISSSPFPAPADAGQLSKQKQILLLQPFGKVKSLREFKISTSGSITIYPSVKKSLEEEMNKPHDPPEVCLESATALKDKGNAELTAQRYRSALEFYNAAFLAIHIVIQGTERRVYGDQWFDTTITAPGPFQNQHAATARIILRVRLVANSVLAYLKLKDYDMAIHTGMRTIKIMRASIGLDEEDGASDPRTEAMMGFVAAGEMGKIYYRTGMAYKEIDEKGDARKLLKVAAVYLPHDKTVAQELAKVALRLA